MYSCCIRFSCSSACHDHTTVGHAARKLYTVTRFFWISNFILYIAALMLLWIYSGSIPVVSGQANNTSLDNNNNYNNTNSNNSTYVNDTTISQPPTVVPMIRDIVLEDDPRLGPGSAMRLYFDAPSAYSKESIINYIILSSPSCYAASLWKGDYVSAYGCKPGYNYTFTIYAVLQNQHHTDQSQPFYYYYTGIPLNYVPLILSMRNIPTSGASTGTVAVEFYVPNTCWDSCTKATFFPKVTGYAFRCLPACPNVFVNHNYSVPGVFDYGLQENLVLTLSGFDVGVYYHMSMALANDVAVGTYSGYTWSTVYVTNQAPTLTPVPSSSSTIHMDVISIMSMIIVMFISMLFFS